MQSSPGPEAHHEIGETKESPLDGLEVHVPGEEAERKSSASSSGSIPLVNGGESPQLDSHRVTNGHSTEVSIYMYVCERERGVCGGGGRGEVDLL